MADGEKIIAKDGWTVLKKGYTPASTGKEQGGYTGTTGQLGTPPTSGSAVPKPAEPKKD